MPVGAITAAATVGGAVVSSNASSKASKAATKASDQNAAIQQAQYAQTRADLQPYASAGNTATAALMQRLGLSTPATATTATATPATTATTTPAKSGPSVLPGVPDTGSGVIANASAPATTAGTQDWAQLLKDRPDVMAAYTQGHATADQNSPHTAAVGLADNPEDYAKYWYNNMGGNTSYQFPQTATATTTPTQPAATAASTIPGQTLTSADNGGLGARPDATRPGFSQAEPTYTAPAALDVSAATYQNSPFYNLGLAEAERNVNASFGARGLLKSGAGLKASTDTATNNFLTNYGNWANQQLGVYNTNLAQYNTDRNVGLGQYNADRNVFNQNYNTDTARNDNIFTTDRAYNTDQYNTYTGNLFNLASQGQAAAAGQANAGQNYAANATANNNALASVQGNAAIAQANGINSAISTGLQAYGASQNPFASTTATNSWTGF